MARLKPCPDTKQDLHFHVFGVERQSHMRLLFGVFRQLIRAGTLLLALALAALVPIASAAQQSKPTIRHHRVAEEVPDESSSPEVDQAEAAMQHNDFATAETLLQKAVVAKPGDYRAWFDLGYVYNATQRLSEAVEAYRKSVAAKPDVFESNLNLGLLLAKQGDNTEAAKYLKAATQLKPAAHPEDSMARAWQALGQVLQAGDPQQALAAYTEAAKADPKDPQPHIFSARLLEKQNQPDAAIREYQAALQLEPKSEEALAGLVNIYAQQKKYGDAEAELRKILAADPQSGPAHTQLGRVLMAEGKYDQAAQELQAGSQGSPADPHIALDLGVLYFKAGKNAEAEQQLRLAVQKMPRDAQARFELGSLLRHEKKNEEAQQQLIAAVTLKPDFPEAYGELAVAATANKNYGLALKALDDGAKYEPENAALVFLRATTYDNLKAVPQAVEYYQQFLAMAGGQFYDQEWQARHRLIALDPRHADKYRVKK